MRERELSPAGFFLFLFVSLLTGIQNDIAGRTLRPGQPDRQKFFAVRVVSEENVLNSKDALGAPDARHTEIRPGGQLVVLMAQKFIDFGTIISKGEMDYSLEGLFHLQDTGDARQDYAWILFWSGGRQVPGMWPGGFRFEPGQPAYGGVPVDTIRIISVGPDSLFVDAVVGYGRETEKSLRQ
jgi:hypothetical protein